MDGRDASQPERQQPRTGKRRRAIAPPPPAANLATLFSRDVQTDTDATDALWDRFQAARLPADRDALFAHYAPVAYALAHRLKRRKPDFYGDPVDDLVSDACLGLLAAIVACRSEHPIGRRVFVRLQIVRAVRREVHARHWTGRRCSERRDVLARLRGELTQEFGGLPTRAETTARLAGLVTNPNLYVGDAPDMLHASQDEAIEREVEAAIAPAAEPPDRRALDREAVALAMKGLSPADRKLLRAALRGESNIDVAKRLGVHRWTAARRLNGVLWEARARADLAAYLDVEPTPVPADRYACQLPPIDTLPPARRVG